MAGFDLPEASVPHLHPQGRFHGNPATIWFSHRPSQRWLQSGCNLAVYPTKARYTSHAVPRDHSQTLRIAFFMHRWEGAASASTLQHQRQPIFCILFLAGLGCQPVFLPGISPGSRSDFMLKHVAVAVCLSVRLFDGCTFPNTQTIVNPFFAFYRIIIE